MQKLNLYMRAVVVTALLVVGGLGVYKGRGMLNGSKVPKIVEKKDKAGNDKSATTLAALPDAATPAPTSEVKSEKKSSLLSSFKFGNASKSTATSLNDDPPPAAPSNPLPSNDYAAPPAAPVYGNANDTKPSSPPAFAGYGADAPQASPLSPPPVMIAEHDPPSAPKLPPSPNFNTGGYGAATPVNEAAAPENMATNEPPANPLPTPTLSGGYAPTKTPAEAVTAPPTYAATSPANNTLNDYAPTRPPELPTNRTINSAAASPLSTPLPASSVQPASRYADEVNTAAAATSSQVDPQLQGPQTPSIVLEKFAPPEVQVGKAAMFEIQVKNVGKVSAFDVQVVDEIPRGTRYQQANPQPSQTAGGKLLWKLGVMKPGEEKIIELQLVPEAEGEIGSVAQVSFQAQVGSKSVVTKPKLELKHQAPSQIHAGENATIKLSIANNGSGAANGVYLESDVPEGFSHPAGKELEFQIGTLRPGETKTVELVMKAEKAGNYQSVLMVHGEPDISVQDVAKIEIVAPGLRVQVQGPTKRFVERQATHVINIANPGTAPAKAVDLVAYLPRGFKFISADQQGQYDARQHAVTWGLEELPAGSSGSVQLTTLPVEAGDQTFRVAARSATGLAADTELNVAVDSTSELPFTVADLADPIEVNSETVYEVRVANRGAKAATNVRIAAVFPQEIKPLEGDGAAKATITGQKVEFASIGSIAPGTEAVVKIQAQGLRPGDHRVAVTITSDEHPQPVTREEGTRVYLDR